MENIVEFYYMKNSLLVKDRRFEKTRSEKVVFGVLVFSVVSVVLLNLVSYFVSYT